MKKHFWVMGLVLAAILGGAIALATGDAGAPASGADEADDIAGIVVLGEEDLAERAEILRNMYRRITPPDLPLVQDVGTWPAAWEEFGRNWDTVVVGREYGAWVVPVEVSQEAGLTVMKDGDGAVLWRGWTDFARPGSADVVLTGGLVAEEEWAAYVGVREEVESMRETAGGTPAPPVMRTGATNGLRFTAHEWTTNDTFRLELAYEIDTNVDIFAYAVEHASNVVVATWTNDENQVITDTNTVWTSVGLPFNGMESDWEQRGTVAISNGVAEFEDSGFSEELSRLRFYAAAVTKDTDGDGLNDGWEDFVSHTDPTNQDSDGDGVPDGMDTMPATSNVWFEAVTEERLYYWEYRGTCGSNSPPVFVRSWPLSGQPPTLDSVVRDVRVSGFVDDCIKVDEHAVDFEPSTQTFTDRSILNEISDPQKRDFSLALWDYPDPDHAGENEVKLGSSESDKFVVEWVWGVPMSVTGPECLCVGDSAQFEAGGAGGGPYTWSVTYEGTTPVAEIDGDGVFTALAPGIATVTASAGRAYAVSQEVNVVQIEFLAGGGNAAESELKVGKWNNAFTVIGSNAVLKSNFIDLDPDRFRIRVQDTVRTGDGTVAVLLSTDHWWGETDDGATGIDLVEQPANSGIFLSTNLLLVADDIDDNYSGAGVPADDVRNDRTHRVGLRGSVRVRYPETGTAKATKDIQVKRHGTVHVIPIILRDAAQTNGGSAVVSEWQVDGYLEIAKQRYAQVGVDLTWDYPVVCDPPAGVNLTDGFLVRTNTDTRFLAPEAKAAIAGLGTVGNTGDIHLIYVNEVKIGLDLRPGSSVADYWYDESEEGYLYNVFMGTGYPDVGEGYAIAHELGHLLTDDDHSPLPWQLMYHRIRLEGPTASRRFVNSEETSIKDNSHVQK